jgi:hypothetical protein
MSPSPVKAFVGSQFGLYLLDHEAEIPFQYPHSQHMAVRPVASVYLLVQSFAGPAQSRCNAACSHRLNLMSRNIQDIGRHTSSQEMKGGEALNRRIHRSKLRNNRTGCKAHAAFRGCRMEITAIETSKFRPPLSQIRTLRTLERRQIAACLPRSPCLGHCGRPRVIRTPPRVHF